MARVRVAVADSDATYRDELIGLLEGMPELEVVGEAAGVRALINLLERAKPDILLLDLETAGVEAEDLVRKVRLLPGAEPCRVILLAETCRERGLLKAISAGADDYLLKKSRPVELRKTILQVFAGKPGRSRHHKWRALRLQADPADETGVPCLSRREMEVLALLEQGKTSVQIAEQLFISENTVKTHVRHILGKLSVSSRAEAVRKAAELGLI